MFSLPDCLKGFSNLSELTIWSFMGMSDDGDNLRHIMAKGGVDGEIKWLVDGGLVWPDRIGAAIVGVADE